MNNREIVSRLDKDFFIADVEHIKLVLSGLQREYENMTLKESSYLRIEKDPNSEGYIVINIIRPM